jgi:hypothetical protein
VAEALPGLIGDFFHVGDWSKRKCHEDGREVGLKVLMSDYKTVNPPLNVPSPPGAVTTTSLAPDFALVLILIFTRTSRSSMTVGAPTVSIPGPK